MLMTGETYQQWRETVASLVDPGAISQQHSHDNPHKSFNEESDDY